jgi:predicted RNA-binding Zn ribbon-like protein
MKIYDEAKPTNANSRAASLTLVAGALALDFANSASGRGSARYQEHLQSCRDVVAWAANAGVIDEVSSRLIADRIMQNAPEFEHLLHDALALREAIYEIAVAIAHRAPPAREHLDLVSARCAMTLGSASLEMGTDGARWRWPHAPPMPATILGPVALSAVGLLRESDPARIRQCAGEHCGWVFFDMTKNRSRRWCEMSVCGNRAKAKAHYRRAKSKAETGHHVAQVVSQ